MALHVGPCLYFKGDRGHFLSFVIDEASDPAHRAPGGVPAAAGFLLQLVRAQLTAEFYSF